MNGADVRVGNYRYLLNQQTLFIREFLFTPFVFSALVFEAIIITIAFC